MSVQATSRRRSLVAALFGRMGLLLLAVVAGVGLVAFFTAQRQVEQVYDGQLIIGANVLRALMTEELQAPPRPGAPDEALLSAEDRKAFDDYAEWRTFRIWRRGRVVMRSDTGPPLAAPPLKDGFGEMRGANGQRWRVYTLWVPGRAIAVQVGEQTRMRLILVRRIALGAALPLLLLIPTAAGLIWLSLNDGLRALRLLIAEIGRRGRPDLAPLPLAPWPRDLHPLVRSINLMLGRIEGAVLRERSFLDNAAHQLRTPLAAVKLQAQMIAQETDAAERDTLTRRLVESVDRAASTTDSLLTLARLEARAGAEGERRRGDLRAEAVAAMADVAPLAARRQVELAFDGPQRAQAGDPVLLRLIAANLIENAVTHAPADSLVEVRIEETADGHRLTVADRGPGIAPAERPKVIERFYRGRAVRPTGAGLGLSIVSEAVGLLGGRLSLEDRADGLSGLCAIVEIPSG